MTAGRQPTFTELARAVETVRHRGLMKRPDRADPDVAKPVTPADADWQPCEVCRDEARLILAALGR